MPIDKSQLDNQVRAAFLRQERYARRVKLLYDDYADQILKLVNSYPGIDPTKPFSFSKYPALQRKVDVLLKELSGNVLKEVQSGIEIEWELSNKVNDQLVKKTFGTDVMKDKRFERFFGRNIEAREAFKGRIVARGMDLSKRIWIYTGIMKNEMDAALEVALTEGKSAVEISREVHNYLREPDRLFRRVMDEKGILRLSKAFHPGAGMYRSSFKNAMRLARTETNMAYKTADHTRYQQLDFVVGFEVKLSKSHAARMPNGDMCDVLAGKYPKDFKFTGWHVQCMCYVTSILMTDDEFSKMQDKILAGEPTGGMTSANQVKNMPDGFKKWIAENKERVDDWKEQPYFIQDNFKGGRIEGGLKIRKPAKV